MHAHYIHNVLFLYHFENYSINVNVNMNVNLILIFYIWFNNRKLIIHNVNQF